MATNPFQQLDVIRKASRKGKQITDCYRLMYKKEIWLKAHEKLYPNTGNYTKQIESIIEQLKARTFRFTPIKTGGKGVANNREKIAIKVIGMILENVYEPIFSKHSYGFRVGSYHTALSQIKHTWNGLTWCIQGDFLDIFHHMDYVYLLNCISKKINDHRFLLLLHNLVSSGIMTTLHRNFISPLFVHIYLHEFDVFIEKLMNHLEKRKLTSQKNTDSCSRFNTKNRNLLVTNNEETIESKQINHNQLRMKYTRYANHFVLGMACSKQNARHLKELIHTFLQEKPHLNGCRNSLRLNHLEDPISFLGYQFRKTEKSGSLDKAQKHSLKKKRIKDSIKLEIPRNKFNKFASKYGYGNLHNFKIIHRKELMNYSEIEILSTYNNELIEIATYYQLANNYHQLNKLFYLAKKSFIKTIAFKRRSTPLKVALSMKTHKQGALCLLEKDKHGNEKFHQFVQFKHFTKKLFNIRR